MRVKWVVNEHVALVTECPNCGDFVNYEPGDSICSCYSCKSIFGVIPFTAKILVSFTSNGFVTTA